MKTQNMILGMGLAAAAGAAAAMALSSHQKPIKKAAEKADILTYQHISREARDRLRNR